MPSIALAATRAEIVDVDLSMCLIPNWLGSGKKSGQRAQSTAENAAANLENPSAEPFLPSVAKKTRNFSQGEWTAASSTGRFE
jgi:hypothetical protein